MTSFRTEPDSIGQVKVPAHAYWVRTPSAPSRTFPSRAALAHHFIHALGLVKNAAATANRDLGMLKPELAAPIIKAAREILADASWTKNNSPSTSTRPAPAPRRT